MIATGARRYNHLFPDINGESFNWSFGAVAYPKGEVAALIAVQSTPLVAMNASCPLSLAAFRMKAIELRNPDSTPAPIRIGVVSSDFLITKVVIRENVIEENIIAMTGFMIG
jgi:hypothetical protein